jgi:flap endonuclease-1
VGVKFKDIITPEPIEMNQIKGHTVTVDASNIIYKFLSSIRQADGTPLKDMNGNITSHLSGIMFQTSSLISIGIKPVYVFDGKSPELKKKTQEERIAVKKESEKKYEEAKLEGDIEKARKYASRTSHLNKEIISTSKTLLDLMGVPYVQSKTEGEAQASYMVSRGDAWAVVSQDYDCLQFGATRMIRNLRISKNQTKNLEEINLNNTLKELGITREQLVDIALLVGTDFNDGIYGIGAKKGLKLIKEQGTLENALKKLDKTMEIDPDILRDIFLNPDVVTDYDISYKAPKKQKLLDYLCGEHDFQEQRTESAIKKLQEETGQTSLEQWF